MSQGTEQFDVFLSYSHKDLDWLKSVLIPKLELLEIDYAVDYLHFTPARSVQSELVRLMKLSRRTLIVLTSQWLSSNWTMFEAQSSGAFSHRDYATRLLLLKVENCETPQLLRNVTAIDLPVLGEAKAFFRLRRTIIGARISREAAQPLNGGVTLWRRAAGPTWFERRESSHEYLMQIDVENRVPTELQFDSVNVCVLVPESLRIPESANDTVRIVFTKTGHTALYSNRGSMGLPELYDTDTAIEVVVLKGPKGIRLDGIRTNFYSSVPGVCIFQLAISLYYADTKVTTDISCALPPVTRLPEYGSGSAGLYVPCIPIFTLPSPTGLTDPDLASSLFDTASAFGLDSILVSVSARFMTLWSGAEYGHVQQFEEWICEFSSESRNTVFYISTQDTSWIDESQNRSGHLKPPLWLTPDMIGSCTVDATLAYLIALQSGARCLQTVQHESSSAETYDLQSRRNRRNMQLEAMELDGRWRPVWALPLDLNTATVLVTADTGEIWRDGETGFEKMRQQLWNR